MTEACWPNLSLLTPVFLYLSKLELFHSNHVSEGSKARPASPLKSLQKYVQPGAIMLAGGLPNPSYFPFSGITAHALMHDSFAIPDSESSKSSFNWLWKLFGMDIEKEKSEPIYIPKYSSDATGTRVVLAESLQYAPARALAHLQRVIDQIATELFQPAYLDYRTLANTGNTDGWDRVIAVLCNPGDKVLMAEWVFTTAKISMPAHFVSAAKVAMDSEGIRPDALRERLANWDAEAEGAPRPHVMYVVPIGQNPTGATMSLERKKAIYEVCVEYDVIICEDDPYYFLQLGEWLPSAERSANRAAKSPREGVQSFVDELVPSFLKIDYQGRVIRLDTFSKFLKTIAPGSRLGWFTCNALFAERFEREAETTVLSPNGFSQAIIQNLLEHWQYDGFVRWVQGLRMQYKLRRDFFVDCLHNKVHLTRTVGTEGVWSGSPVYVAYARDKSSAISEKFRANDQPLFSLVPPTSGMFVWIKLYFDRYRRKSDEEPLEMQLWIKLAQADVVLAPGMWFSAEGVEAGDPGHFRASFSMSSQEDIKKAIGIFVDVVSEFYKELEESIS